MKVTTIGIAWQRRLSSARIDGQGQGGNILRKATGSSSDCWRYEPATAVFGGFAKPAAAQHLLGAQDSSR